MATVTSPSRDRAGLGRGVRTLIPSAPQDTSPSEQAAAALAALRTVAVPAGVLRAAAVLLGELTDSEDQAVQDVAVATRAHLLSALGTLDDV
ncbi:hypothetical protein [Streptomyces lavendulocolor]|uniref:hypothetical protein n=1 Tax=Streptomyces lavendulocolor TaxID=67316 RepID=UPI003C2BAF72